jgi:hypothetical protein
LEKDAYPDTSDKMRDTEAVDEVSQTHRDNGRVRHDERDDREREAVTETETETGTETRDTRSETRDKVRCIANTQTMMETDIIKHYYSHHAVSMYIRPCICLLNLSETRLQLSFFIAHELFYGIAALSLSLCPSFPRSHALAHAFTPGVAVVQ